MDNVLKSQLLCACKIPIAFNTFHQIRIRNRINHLEMRVRILNATSTIPIFFYLVLRYDLSRTIAVYNVRTTEVKDEY